VKDNMNTMNKQEAVEAVLQGLQALIAKGCHATAYKYFCPSHDPDGDGDTIEAGREQVKALRKMREEFENLLLAGGSL
jgi:hypothetical protein